MSDKDKIADAAIDAGYITPAEAGRFTGKTRQAVHARAQSRGVNPKERRQARIVKTMQEIGRLYKDRED